MTVAIVANIARPISSAISTAFSADSYGALSSYGLIGGSTNPDAVITALFASGEQGAWYDPSDLSTMFQDSTGTTPVTADGQPVGLILDKRKGLVLGPELVTNGTFDTTTTGWLLNGSATLTIDTNRAKYTGISANNDIAYQNIITVAGKWYQIKWKAETGTISPRLCVGTAVGNANLMANVDGPGDRTATFLATGSVAVVQIYCTYSLSSQTAFFDNISVKELAGNHGKQSTAASRPLYKTSGLAKYNEYDVVDDVLNTTFSSSLGASCTVAKAVVGGSPTILTGQTIGTTWAESTDNAGVVIVNRALSTQETTDLTAWLTTKGATT